MPTSHSFAFPEDKRDAIERSLRATVDAPLQSIRPERQKKPAIVLTSSSADPTRPEPPLLPKSVPVVLSSQTTPVTSPDAISIDLPSKFHYYGFKDLYVRPLRVTHLAKLAKAVELGS